MRKSYLFLQQNNLFSLSWLKFGMVGSLVAASIVFERLLPLAAAGAIVAWLAGCLAARRITPRTPADIPVWALVVMLPVSLAATALPEKSIPQVYRLLTGIFLFFAIADWAISPERLRIGIGAVAVAGVLLAILALFSVDWALNKLAFFPPSIYGKLIARAGDVIHPNVMAGTLILLLPLPLATILYPRKGMARGESIFYALACAAMVAIVLLTKSRGAWMGAGAAIAALTSMRWRRGWIAALALAMAASILVVIITTRFPDLIQFSNDQQDTLSGRIDIWSRGLYMIRDYPLTGVGMGLYGDLADTFYPFFLNAPGSVPHSHNLFLQVTVDLGIPGLAAWLAIVMAVTAAAWQVLHTAPRMSPQAALGAGLLGSQVALLVHGLSDAVTWGMVRPAPLVWAVWGLSVAALNVYAKPKCLPESITARGGEAALPRSTGSIDGQFWVDTGRPPMAHRLLGVRIHAVRASEVITLIIHSARLGEKAVIAYANAHTFNLAEKLPWFAAWLNRASLVYCDGYGVKWAAHMAGIHLPERFTPPDWFPLLAKACAQEGLRVFFLGAQPGVAAEAARRLQAKHPALEFESYDGYFDKTPGCAENRDVVAKINAYNPHLLVVGMGQPLQERWLEENWESLQATVALPVGAMFDYLAGNVGRAPRWATDHGLEWLGRLLVEPQRMWKRYLIGNPRFFWRVLRGRKIGHGETREKGS